MSYDAYAPARAAAAAAPPRSLLPSSASLTDESASAWIRRDAGVQNVPDAIKHIQGNVRLWSIIPYVEPVAAARKARERGGGGSHSRRGSASMETAAVEFASGGAAAASSHATAATSIVLDPRLHAGELVEIFGRSGSGKTETLYQCALRTLLPKTLVSPHFDHPLPLGGHDQGVVLIDFDARFNIRRMEQLMRSYITGVVERIVMRQAAEAADDEDMQLQRQLNARNQLLNYFASVDYSTLRSHCLANLFVFTAQTPRQAMGVLTQVQECCDQYAQSKGKKTWEQKQQEKDKQRQQEEKNNAEESQNNMIDIHDPSYNPRLSVAASVAAAAASRSSSAPPRISLLLIDNISSMAWIVKGQPPGYAGMATGMHAKERIALGAGIQTSTASGNGGMARGQDPQHTWFYEMFSAQLHFMLNKCQLIGIATKLPSSRGAAENILKSFEHVEYLGLSWNSLVNYRLVIRGALAKDDRITVNNHAPGSAEYLALRAEQADIGVLHEAQLKDILASSKSRNDVMMSFKFRLGTDGIKPAD